jgi:hypothetical protein
MTVETLNGIGVSGPADAVEAAPTKKRKWSGVKKGTEEYRAIDRADRAERRAANKAQAALEAQGLKSEIELTKKEITRLLIDERKLRPQVAAQYANLVLVAARAHKLPANQFLVRYGLKNTVHALQEHPVELPSAAQETIDGEVQFTNELCFAHDFSMWRQPEVSFEQFLNNRRRAKTDAMFVGELVGKPFHQCHENWTNFFPRFNPDGLVPNYTQQQVEQWLSKQTDRFKTFMLLATRNARKSTWSKCWVLSFVLCLPDSRVLLVSETHELSQAFIGELRGWLEVIDESEPTKFQQLFPDYAIQAGEGQGSTYEAPIRRFGLPAPTLRSASADSSTVGGRTELLLCDDILSDKSCGNEKQTQATVKTFDALQKLVVVNGITGLLGTPWSETPPDLYKTLIDREEMDPESSVTIRIDPIMEIKPSAKNKKLTHLVEDDIESFLFPEVLNWRFIRTEIMRNPADTRFFESQNLVRFVPPEESKWKVNFDEDELRNLIVFQTRFTGWAPLRSILSVDTASSVNRYANMSCIAFSKLFEDAKDGKRYFSVIDIDANKYRPSEIAQHVADAVYKYSPDVITIERPGLWQALQTLIEQEANRRGFSLINRIHWREPGNSTAKSKAARIKNLEPLVKDQRLLFLQGGWNELAIQQFLHFDGVKKSGSAPTSLDDIPDAIAMGVERVAMELLKVLPPQKSESEMEADILAQANAVRAAHYDRMFSSGIIPLTRPAEPEAVPQGPFERAGLYRLGPPRATR